MINFDKIIEEICQELNIKLTKTSDNWVRILEKDNKIHYIVGYKFDLNNYGIGSILDDKGLFYDICKIKNIPIVYQKVIFNNYKKEEVLEFFNKNNQEIIVKGNIGTCGKEVYKVNKEDDLFKVIDNLFKKEYSISLSPFYKIKNEYRVILLNKEEKIVYGKERPSVIGDGYSSLYELSIKFNDYYQENIVNNKDYIPKLGEEILLDYKFNLSRGAKMFLDINNELKEKIINIAKKVVKELDISFCSVDIIYTTDNKLLVMEANSGVMMSNFIRFNQEKGYNIAYNIYKEAIISMFRES